MFGEVIRHFEGLPHRQWSLQEGVLALLQKKIKARLKALRQKETTPRNGFFPVFSSWEGKFNKKRWVFFEQLKIDHQNYIMIKLFSSDHSKGRSCSPSAKEPNVKITLPGTRSKPDLDYLNLWRTLTQCLFRLLVVSKQGRSWKNQIWEREHLFVTRQNRIADCAMFHPPKSFRKHLI